ncbi:MAG: hypothetical protein V4724_21965 [Pseudomonadota bacterium]
MKKLNIFFFMGLVGMAVTGSIQLLSTYFVKEQQPGFWVPFYIVWLVFSVIGLVQTGGLKIPFRRQ